MTSLLVALSDQLTVRRTTNFLRIFNVTTPGVVVFSGLTITGGAVSGSGNNGGGIQNLDRGTVNVTNCILTSNSANSGGAIYNSSTGTVNMSNCMLSGTET